MTLLRHTRPSVGADICYGISDFDVADSFAQDAGTVLEVLPALDRIVTSPLLRCRRLARYIAEFRDLPVVEDSRLREMNFGTWEGRAWADIPRCEIDLWGADFLNARPHGGESVAAVRARAGRALAEIAQAHWRERVLIVTHAGIIRTALATGDTAADHAATIGFGGFVTLFPNVFRSEP